MVYAGARGETAYQLQDALGLSDFNDTAILDYATYLSRSNTLLGDRVRFISANKAYPAMDFSIQRSYIDILKKNFKAETQRLNFTDEVSSRRIINKWVAEKTNLRIKKLIPEKALPEATKLVLVNAIFFRANWTLKFNKDMTKKEQDFSLKDGSKANIDMMVLKEKHLRYLASPGEISADVLELPYSGNTAAMTIILPHKSSSLNEVENQLNGQILEFMMKMETPETKCNVQLPKFKIVYNEEVFCFF
jgi:serpin B